MTPQLVLVDDATPQTAAGVRPHGKAPIAALDGIRGVACLLVVVDHFAATMRDEYAMDNPIIRAAVGGWCGVDLFFVLSGFLITGILFDSRSSPKYFTNFFARRMLRIFPLYFGLLLVVALRCLLVPGATYGGLSTQMWMWTYLTNVGIVVKGFLPFAFLGHLWSLAVEEHFYLVWPCLVLLLSRRALMITAGAIVGVAFAARCLAVLGAVNADAIYILTPFRADALALGGLVALLARGSVGLRPLVRPVRWMAGVAAIILALVAVADGGTLPASDPIIQTVGYSALAVLSAGIIVLSLTVPWAARVLSIQPLRSIGKYSYGLYVWHPIVLQVFHPRVSGRVWAAFGTFRTASLGLAFAALLVAVSLASFHFWEKPFLGLKRHFE